VKPLRKSRQNVALSSRSARLSVPLGTLPDVGEAFIGSEAVKSGALTRYQLRSRFVALYPDVYIAPDTSLTATTRAGAAWLWSRRRGVVAGHSASALHGAKWINHRAPAQLLYEHRRPPAGIYTWSDTIAEDETQLIGDVLATTPARTAFDLACRNPVDKAVAAIDALARATRLKVADAELVFNRHKGHRNIRRARRALELVDSGAQSPRETVPMDVAREVRFAVVMYGGVSLAIYINGVAQELLNMARATAPKAADDGEALLGTDPKQLTGSLAVYRKLGQYLHQRSELAEMAEPDAKGNPKPPSPRPIQTRFVVDVISGTSAGGRCGSSRLMPFGRPVVPDEYWSRSPSISSSIGVSSSAATHSG